MFSCDPQGEYALTDLFREENGSVYRQIYADGYLPLIENLPGTVHENVTLFSTGICADYNEPATPIPTPQSAGMIHRISGGVLLQDMTEPVCALVLANGSYVFSCDNEGSYELEFPLDSNGHFTLQVYADGFAPAIQIFDVANIGGDVHMARSTECQ